MICYKFLGVKIYINMENMKIDIKTIESKFLTLFVLNKVLNDLNLSKKDFKIKYI